MAAFDVEGTPIVSNVLGPFLHEYYKHLKHHTGHSRADSFAASSLLILGISDTSNGWSKLSGSLM